ncbi:hypothetical protein V8F06_012546 [Rhypophila decipiens]
MPLPRQSSFVAERGPGEFSGDQSRRTTTPHTPLIVERIGRRRYAQLGCCQKLADDPARLFHVVRMGRSPAKRLIGSNFSLAIPSRKARTSFRLYGLRRLDSRRRWDSSTMNRTAIREEAVQAA